MKLTYLLFILVFSISSCFSQENSAAFISYKGEGKYTRGSITEKLKFPMLFSSGDEIHLKTGKAKLIIANGNEIDLKAGDKYKVPKLNKEEIVLNLDASVYQDFTIQPQGNVSVKLRDNNTIFFLFPENSKMIKTHSNKIIISGDIKNLNLKIEISDANSLDVVYSGNIVDSVLKLQEFPLEDGKDYTWTLYSKTTNFEHLGLISVLSEIETSELPNFKLKSVSDYLRTFQYYQKNEFFFETYNIIEKANKRFPEIDFFRLMLQKMQGK